MSVCSGWAGAAEVVLHENSSGQEVIVRRGDRLVVRLSSNRTTGYSWDAVITHPGKLTQQGVPLYRPARDRHLVGAGGLEIWSFRAIHRGHTKLIFHYARPWERGIPPVRTLFWLITIT
jgi:inhibitor of cysteine peptidase